MPSFIIHNHDSKLANCFIKNKVLFGDIISTLKNLDSSIRKHKRDKF